MHDSHILNGSSFSAPTLSVVVSLRWAFLKALEKPLRFVNYPGLAVNVLTSHSFSVSVQFDYYCFRDISASLTKEHPEARDEPMKSRVAFSPSFHTTKSGSSAVNNLNILFSSLADLTSFLRIRDDNDFESILSKEVLSDTSTVL